MEETHRVSQRSFRAQRKEKGRRKIDGQLERASLPYKLYTFHVEVEVEKNGMQLKFPIPFFRRRGFHEGLC